MDPNQCQHGEGGAEGVEAAVEQGGMSSGDKQLVKLVRQGVSGCGEDAQRRPAWPPKVLPPTDWKTVEKQGKDAVFSHMGQLAENGV
jgi:hypothetical protein